jgi:hypothetical protein
LLWWKHILFKESKSIIKWSPTEVAAFHYKY